MSMKLEQQQENESTPHVKTLLTALQLGALSLPNRIAMSPMAREAQTVFLWILKRNTIRNVRQPASSSPVASTSAGWQLEESMSWHLHGPVFKP